MLGSRGIGVKFLASLKVHSSRGSYMCFLSLGYSGTEIKKLHLVRGEGSPVFGRNV